MKIYSLLPFETYNHRAVMRLNGIPNHVIATDLLFSSIDIVWIKDWLLPGICLRMLKYRSYCTLEDVLLMDIHIVRDYELRIILGPRRSRILTNHDNYTHLIIIKPEEVN